MLLVFRPSSQSVSRFYGSCLLTGLSKFTVFDALPSLASIPGRVLAFITVRQTTSCLPNRYKSKNSAWDRGYSFM